MKALVVCALLGLAIASTPSCSIDHASDAIACDTQADCDASRTCMNGYCVVVTNTMNPSCPTICTTCDMAQKSCVITNPAGGKTTCPSGWNCTITCGANACREVDCEQAASCTLECTGADSCTTVKCGSGRCALACSGAGSCDDVDCRSSCACDVTCSDAACGNTRCPGQCTTPNGCTSQPPACNRCQ